MKGLPYLYLCTDVYKNDLLEFLFTMYNALWLCRGYGDNIHH